MIAVGMLVLFYTWLGHYAYSPGDSPSGTATVARGAGAGNRVTSRSHGLVAGFRKDIPIYTPSRVRTCHLADPDKKGEAVLHSANPIERVSGFYRSEMVESGWKVKELRPRDNGGNAGSIVWFRGEKAGSLLNIELTGNAQGTDIRFELLPKPVAAVVTIPSS